MKRSRRRGGQRNYGHERPFLTTLEAQPMVGQEVAQPDRRPAVAGGGSREEEETVEEDEEAREGTAATESTASIAREEDTEGKAGRASLFGQVNFAKLEDLLLILPHSCTYFQIRSRH
ncbi:hypothetical protein E2C01_051722 [Portunus trituberculatus]|uniref:Uncharacterized protein n=1 Tax=Portunus trituberculatus TaxID=210409 RepID=A0A5B7GK43_PORTR|nr:hypothetical protein [Portunus trituberculatus]